MIKPPYLVKGDTIGIIAPAKSVQQNYIEESVRILKSWGLNVILSSNIFKSDFQYAGTDIERLAALQEMLDNDEIKAILCARGGYGTTRIVDQVSLKRFKNAPKWVIGYSDITALLIKIHNAGFESIHGPMPISMASGNDPQSLDLLKKILFGDPSASCKFNFHSLNVEGSGTGSIVGGNLTMICNCIGTPTDLPVKNNILFLEDIDEYLYRIDRMMIQLKRSGKLGVLAGLIVGHMTQIKDNEDPFGKSSYEVILEHTKDHGYPVCFGAPIGHEAPNYPLIIGQEVRLVVNSDFTELIFKK